MKKSTAFITVFSMVLSCVIGICGPKETVKAAVASQLPNLSGLYVAEYHNWDDETGKVRTDTDTAGNTILVNADGEQIRYRDQDDPQYLYNGISDGWGMGFDNNDEKWFDYIANGKVTHVAPSELTITHLDGTPCEDISIEAKEEDPRIAVFRVKKLTSKIEFVKISYKGAETNNALIGEFALRSGIYTSETMTLESQVTGDVNIAKDKSKELYLHLTDSWEEAGFRLDPDNAVTIRYWDGYEKQDVELSGADTKDFASLTPVSVNDPHHLIYKVTLQGKKSNENDGYDLKICYQKYNTKDESEQWDEDRNWYVRVSEGDMLYAADNIALNVKGNQYTYPDNADYHYNLYYGAGNTKNAAYMRFRYMDADANMTDVTDPAKLSAYRTEYDETEGREIYIKVDSSVVKIEKAYQDSSIMKISYLGDVYDFGNEYVITYDGAEPKDDFDKNIKVSFVPAHFSEVATYLSPKISDSTYGNEVKTDGTSDVVVYAATVDMKKEIFWNQVQSVKIDKLTLTDENGNDLSASVLTDQNVTFTEETGRGITYGERITIPKGILHSSARLRLRFMIHSLGGDGIERDFDATTDVFIFYSAPSVTPTPGGQPTTPVSIAKASVTGIKASYSYTGKAQKPIPIVKVSGKTLVAQKDYTYSYSNNTAVGNATLTIKGMGSYTGKTTVTFKITKAANPLTLKVSQKTYDRKKDLKKKVSFQIGAKKAQGTVTYTLDKKAKKANITVSKKGKVTIPKKCKKGTYTIIINAKGNKNYLSVKKKTTIKIK